MRQLGTFAWTDQKGKTRRCYHERKPNKPTNTGNVIESSAFSSGIATVENLTKEEAFDDWRVKISYPYQDVTAWHKPHWNSQDQLPNGERIGYIVFYSTDEQVAAETSGEMDVTFTMKGLKRLIWQSQTSENTRNPSASD